MQQHLVDAAAMAAVDTMAQNVANPDEAEQNLQNQGVDGVVRRLGVMRNHCRSFSIKDDSSFFVPCDTG
jgi:hypothetical protein